MLLLTSLHELFKSGMLWKLSLTPHFNFQIHWWIGLPRSLQIVSKKALLALIKTTHPCPPVHFHLPIIISFLFLYWCDVKYVFPVPISIQVFCKGWNSFAAMFVTVKSGTNLNSHRGRKERKKEWSCSVVSDSLHVSDFWDSMGKSAGGIIWENSIETCILSYVK